MGKTQQTLIIAFNCCLLWSESLFYLKWGLLLPAVIIAICLSTELAPKELSVIRCNQAVSQHPWKVGKPVFNFSCKIHGSLPPLPDLHPCYLILKWWEKVLKSPHGIKYLSFHQPFQVCFSDSLLGKLPIPLSRRRTGWAFRNAAIHPSVDLCYLFSQRGNWREETYTEKLGNRAPMVNTQHARGCNLKFSKWLSVFAKINLIAATLLLYFSDLACNEGLSDFFKKKNPECPLLWILKHLDL